MRRLAFLICAAVVLCACGRSKPAAWGSIVLPKLDGSGSVSLASCPTPRCLAVYVAPWCHYCRAATPLIRELRQVLRSQQVESWVVVGLDREPAVREYARSFGGDTLLDLQNAIEPGGVPHFYVLDNKGAVLRQIAGLPPDPRELLAWVLQ